MQTSLNHLQRFNHRLMTAPLSQCSRARVRALVCSAAVNRSSSIHRTYLARCIALRLAGHATCRRACCVPTLIPASRSPGSSTITAKATTVLNWTTAGATGSGTDIAAAADGSASTTTVVGWLAFSVTSGVAAMSTGTANNCWRLIPTSGATNIKWAGSIFCHFSTQIDLDSYLRKKAPQHF